MKVKKRKRWWKVLVTALLAGVTAFGTLGVITACDKKDSSNGDLFPDSEYSVFVKESSSKTEIGVKGLHSMVFEKSGDEYTYAGFYVDGEQVSSNELFTSFNNSVSPKIIDSLTKKSDTSIEVKGPGYTLVLSVEENSPYIKRDFTLEFSNKFANDTVQAGDIKFYIKGAEGKYVGEQGFVGTYAEADDLIDVYASLPIINSQLLLDGEGSTALSMVMDRYTTDGMFRLARRYYNSMSGSVEVGFLTEKTNGIVTGKEYKYVDYVMMGNGEENDYYVQLEESRKCLKRIDEVQYEELYSYDNRAVDDWSIVVSGLVDELFDERANYEAILNSFTPYAYSKGWGEAFVSSLILRGFTKYAEISGDAELQEWITERIRAYGQTINGKNWIEQNGDFGYMIHNSFGGTFSDANNSEASGSTPSLGTWKYFDMVNALGEIAEYTKDEYVTEAFMKLVPMVVNHMVGEDYFQPVCYTIDTLQPLVGLERGGSAGGAAIWGNINLHAYRLTDESDPMHAKYLENAKGSLKRAANLGFEQMWATVEAPKPVSIGFTVRGLVEVYELTGERTYLELAAKCVSGMYHFYYYNSNPYSFFAAPGYSVACALERQEAFLEMGQAVWLCSSLLKYDASVELMELFADVNYSGLWYFPINGEMTGTTHDPERTKTLEWIESKYVPLEFATGATNDPSLSGSYGGGDQRLYRNVKEIYGTGEVFLAYMMYEAFGYSVNKNVTIVCATGGDAVQTDNHIYRAFNAAKSEQKTVLLFTNLTAGTYNLKVNGKKTGIYSSAALAAGLEFEFGAKEIKEIKIEYVSQDNAVAETVTNPTVTAEGESGYVAVSINSNAMAYSHLQVCMNNKFNANNTYDYYSLDGKFNITVVDGATVYLRAKVGDGNGKESGWSDVVKYKQNNVEVLAGDDFSSVSGWAENNTDLACDASAAVMQILGGDVGYGVSSIQKTFTVDATDGDVTFRFIPFAKSDHSTFSVYLTVGENNITVVENSATMLPSYTYKLEGLNKIEDIVVTIEVKGHNRGFAVSRVDFVKEVDTAFNFVNVLDCEYEATATVDTESGVTTISSEQSAEPAKEISTQEVNLKANPYVTVTLGGVRILDCVQVKVSDEDGNKVFETSGDKLYVSKGLIVQFEMPSTTANVAAKYTVSLVSVSGYESVYNAAYIAGVEISANSDYSKSVNAMANSAGGTNITYSFKADLSKAGRLVVDIGAMSKYADVSWSVYLYDVAADRLVEARIDQEIDYTGDFKNEYYLTGKSSYNWYFREKTGVFNYNLFEMNQETAGMRDYQIIVSIEGEGYVTLNRLFITNNNEQIAVCG